MAQLDETILQLINHAGESPVMDFIFVAFTLLGVMVVSLLAAPVLWARCRREGAFDLVVCVVAVSVLVEVIKLVVMRDRPYVALDGLVHTISYHGLAQASGPSFPSGHAARIFAVATVVSSNTRIGARAGAFAIATMVALSRVYLGLHWPSDVLVAALIGILAALLVRRAGADWRPYWEARRRALGWLAGIIRRSAQ